MKRNRKIEDTEKFLQFMDDEQLNIIYNTFMQKYNEVYFTAYSSGRLDIHLVDNKETGGSGMLNLTEIPGAWDYAVCEHFELMNGIK